jgi:hypothetical protein
MLDFLLTSAGFLLCILPFSEEARAALARLRRWQQQDSRRRWLVYPPAAILSLLAGGLIIRAWWTLCFSRFFAYE